MYLIYLYIACTGYWKTNFNGQDWLIESFSKRARCNMIGFGMVQIFLFLPKVMVIDGFIHKFSLSVVNEGKLCFSTILNNMGSLWALPKRERMFLYQVFPQGVLRPQVQFFPTFIMTSWLADTVKPCLTDTVLQTVYVVPGKRKPLYFL